ncbi:hypothetical protein [Segatella copri]|uniref:hypothetical protein n=1 Tax=Segatella copri TaxID=165179 RepID=UPI00294B00FE|nr:hypothetical protein [Segatella copri]WOG31385.1 hypothetical protein RJT04_13505 [Segatella copri]
MEWLKITTNSEIIRIPTDEIIFIKGDGRNWQPVTKAASLPSRYLPIPSWA